MNGHNTQVDPAEFGRAKATWAGFLDFMKISILGIVAILVLMAVFLL